MHAWIEAVDVAATWTAIACAYRAGALRHADPRRAGWFVLAAWLISLLGIAL